MNLSHPATEERIEDLVELTASNLNAQVLEANDEFFAPKENLLKPEPPVFVPDRYTDRGKWMDGWETRRRRGPGYDWCVIRLGFTAVARHVVVDTAFFDGNHPESASLDGGLLPASGRLQDVVWTEVLPPSALQGNYANSFPVSGHQAFRLLRLNIYPDGGVARLHVYGEVVPDWDRLSEHPETEFNLAGLEHGAKVVTASDMHFGSRHNLILPGRPPDMREGWETRRRRGPGNDWCIVRLAATGLVSKIELDTSHFKGNYPDTASLEACTAPGNKAKPGADADWRPLVERTALRPDFRHDFDPVDSSGAAVSHVRLNIFPDGGVSRLRVVGRPSPEGWKELGLRHFNALSASPARKLLFSCCGSQTWVRSMLDKRPFEDVIAMRRAGAASFKELKRNDYLEAFRSHPQIGEKRAAASTSGRARSWSAGEQKGVETADSDVRSRLAEGNRRYLEKFGYIYIVNATGKSAPEMLEMLQSRLSNSPEEELRIAAEQQRQITDLRLEKLFLP